MFDFSSQVWGWIAKGIGYMFGMAKTVVAGLVGRVLGTYGLSVVTFNEVLPDLKSFVSGFFTSLPTVVVELASAVGLDIAMSMIISALTISMAWRVFVIPTSVKNAMQGGGA